MKSLISKARWTSMLGIGPVNWSPANRIANCGLALAITLLIASEEHDRRTWRDRSVESEANLTNVRKFLVLEREHVKKLAKEAQ